MSSTKGKSGQEAWASVHGHKELPEILAPVADEKDFGAMGPQLAALQDHLVSHFDEEEREGGWFEELLEVRPANSHRLDELRAEHKEILDLLGALTTRVKAIADQNAAAQEEKDRLLEQIRQHCGAEHKLALDSYYVDIGGES
jgi:hypothetical protein